MSTPKLRFSLGFHIFPYKTNDFIHIKCMMSIHKYDYVGFLAQCNLDIYTYLCNVFAYFENFMRYIIYKMHILYNNVRKRARVARMYANVREYTCARPPR